MRLDDLISSINGDLQDCLAPVRDRFRRAMLAIFDYAVANPTQGSAATAQNGIASAFKATYADGLVSPGITIEAFVTVFNTRHGAGANANARWVSIRDYIVARKDFRARYVAAMEEGTLPDIPTLVFDELVGDKASGIPQSADLVVTEERETTPGPTYNFLTSTTYSSASLGKSVCRRNTNTFDGQRVQVVHEPLEIV